MKRQNFKMNLIVSAMLPALASASVLAQSTQPSSQSVASHSIASQSIENIMVIGEKTQRSLKDTSASVSVITEQDLKSLQHLTVSDAISGIANLVVLSGSVPDIRGVSGNGGATGFNSFSGGAKARVSTLIDGVSEPFIADLTGDSGIWDIEQIEVFRGPQSTSNGRNSIGGSVYIKTKDPTFDLEGAARVGLRNKRNYLDTSLMLNVPLIDDQLAIRLTGQKLDGDTVNKGIVYDSNPVSFDQNEVKTTRLKAKVLWQPAAIENLSLLLTHSTNHEQGDTGRNYFTADDPWNYIPVTQRYMDTDSATTSVKVDYVINDAVSIDVLASYMRFDWGFDTYEKLSTSETAVVMAQTAKSIDAKLNFGLNSELVSGFVGLAYFERQQDFNSSGATIYQGADTSDSKAIYGEVSYTINELWRLTAGARVEKESQLRDFSMLVRGSTVQSQLDQDKTIRLPKLVVQYALSDDTTLALSARRGYNSAGGAFSFTTSEYYYYDEETVNTYEFSTRSSFANGDISLSSNLFYNDYDGYQAVNSNSIIVNIDKAVTYGLETEISAMLTTDFQLKAGVGLLHSEIKDAGSDYADAQGNELNSAPSFTASLGGTYWLNDKVDIGISTNYVGHYYGDFINNAEREAGGYLLTRLKVNYQTDSLLISAFVNNAFDKQAITSAEPAGGRYPDGYAGIVDARNFGASITYNF